jgi:hypothetical protein
MKTTFHPGRRCDRRLFAAIFALAVVLLVGMSGVAAACGGTQTTTTAASGTPSTQALTTATQPVTTSEAVTTSAAPTTEAVTTTAAPTTTTTVALVPMSKAEIARWKTDAAAFADRFYGAWPDVDASFAQFADDATFYDPGDGDFFIAGKQQIVALHRSFFSDFPKIRVHRTGLYLSADGAAYRSTTENLWPPGVTEPADHPPVGGFDLFRFKDGLVATWEVNWALPETLEMVSMGCFAPGKGGSVQLQKIADRYLAAWSSGDKARIVALYRNDAVFSDTMLGLQAQGPAAISELSDKRFGSAGTTTFEVIDLYVQTNGPDPPTDRRPKQGAIIAVGIHYRCNLVVEGKPVTVESLTTFDLGTRHERSFDIDPDGLITREEVFYDAASLLASGLVR